jgi:pyruvate,water dikinase
MNRPFRSLDQIDDADTREVGGKAGGLARLTRAGFPVPPGFAVTAGFFEEIRSRAPGEPEAEALAEHVPEDLRRALDDAISGLGDAPCGYAIRSSAIGEDSSEASFAGVHDSLLGVPRDRLLDALFRCWASAFSGRAIAYRNRLRLPADPSGIRMAVVVQRMLRPEAAGVLFTREGGDPGGDILIQAVSGSGEALVQGRAEPEVIRVSRGAGNGARRSGPAAPIDDGCVADLAAMAVRVEREWGSPVDLEWALESGRVHLVQARPVTAPVPAGAAREAPAPGESGDTLWTRANLRELVPELPSPLLLSILERIDWLESNRRLGLIPHPGGELFRVIEGRPFFNLTLMGGMMQRLGLDAARVARALGHGDEVPDLSRAPLRAVRFVLLHPVTAFRLARIQSRGRADILEFFREVEARVARLRSADPGTVPDPELREMAREMDAYGADFLHHLQVAFLRVSAGAMALEALLPRGVSLDGFLAAAGAAGESNVSLRQGRDLIALAREARGEGRVMAWLRAGEFGSWDRDLEGTRFRDAFRRYLEVYGHRGLQETDPAMPLYREDPSVLFRAIATAAGDSGTPDPHAARRAQEQAEQEAWADVRGSLSRPERLVPIRLVLLRRTLARLREAAALRERVRFEGMRVAAEQRRFLREAGRRLALRGLLESAADLPLLRIEEIEAVLEGKRTGRDLQDRVRERRAELERRKTRPLPNLVRESEIRDLAAGRQDPVPPGEREAFRGIPVGPGRVEGRVVVLEGPHEIGEVRRGDILIAPAIDPSWIPLFTLASGLVVEMGGTLSHGSIIAREYGLPAVVNIPGITRALRTGERVLLDGGTGTLRRLPAGPSELPESP